MFRGNGESKTEEPGTKLDARAADAAGRDVFRGDLEDEEIASDGSHALITSTIAIGEATAILPVVSTLVFVFALTACFETTLRAHSDLKNVKTTDKVAMVFDALSAALSLYATTYSVLEFYCAPPPSLFPARPVES